MTGLAQELALEKETKDAKKEGTLTPSGLTPSQVRKADGEDLYYDMLKKARPETDLRPIPAAFVPKPKDETEEEKAQPKRPSTGKRPVPKTVKKEAPRAPIPKVKEAGGPVPEKAREGDEDTEEEDKAGVVPMLKPDKKDGEEVVVKEEEEEEKTAEDETEGKGKGKGLKGIMSLFTGLLGKFKRKGGKKSADDAISDPVSPVADTGDTSDEKPASEEDEADDGEPEDVTGDPEERKPVPVGKVPVGKEPVGKVPVGKVPVGKEPVGKEPVGKVPVGKMPVGKEPVGKVPIGKGPEGGEPEAPKPEAVKPARPIPKAVRPPKAQPAVPKAEAAEFGPGGPKE
jgi:hypothetical protein